MRDHLEREPNGDPAELRADKLNIFVLCTGRCGSMTFARACSHMTNYTSGHETRSRKLGEDRFAYPDRHIEVDNRLSWFLGGVDARFGDDAVYVHLTRDPERVARSYNRRWTFNGSILMAFGRGVLKSRSGDLDVARDYVRTTTENITHFLSNKSRVHHIDIDDPRGPFETFWRDIGAEGDLDQALSEFTEKHNESAPSPSKDQSSDADWATAVIQSLETSRDSLRTKVRSLTARNLRLDNAKTALEKEINKFKQYIVASETLSVSLAREYEAMTLSRLAGNKIKLAVGNVNARLRNQPKRSLTKFLPKDHRKQLRTIKKREDKRRVSLENLRLDQDGRCTSQIDLTGRWNQLVRLHPYEAMLRSFYEEHAVAWFERLARNPKTVADLMQANWSLARWHWSKGRFERALSSLQVLRTALPKANWPDSFLSFEACVLAQLGRTDEALARVSGDSPELRLVRFSLLRRAEHDPDLCLEALNTLYRECHLAPVQQRDRARPLSMSNLTAKAEPDPRTSEAKVSVIMPAYDAEETIGFAIDGILRQSWTNLELIVVDDASSDATWSIVCELAKSDPRIVPIRQPENRGAYAARNTGLQAANGGFVTVNDADDWSHPERLALQARCALDDGVANATYGLRVQGDLQLGISGRYRRPLVFNTSSFFFERSVAIELNGWDLVRFSADSEFLSRYERHVGVTCKKLISHVPMAWLLTREESLTQSSVTGIQSVQFGARRQYREAYEDWHANATSLRLGDARAFPVPRIALSSAPDPIVCDELLLSDFSKDDPTETELEAITQALAERRKIALLHLPRLERFGKPINGTVRHLISEYAIPVVVPGESVKAGRTIVLDSSGLEHLPAVNTSVAAETTFIGHADLARLSSTLGEAEAKARIAEVAGNEPEILTSAPPSVLEPAQTD